MATIQGLAAIRNRRTSPRINDPVAQANVYSSLGRVGSEDNPRGPNADVAAALYNTRQGQGMRQNNIPDFQIPQALANNADVNAAYQRMMQGNAAADAQTGILNRNLADTIAENQRQKVQQTLATNAKFADRGIFNSGVALGANNDITANWNRANTDYTNQTNDALAQIARLKLGLSQDWQDAQVNASAQAAQDKADADAQALQDAADAQAQADNMDAIMKAIAALAPAPPAVPPMQYTPIVAKPKPKIPTVTKPAPVSGQTGFLQQGRLVGPQ